ncbi:MAG: RidA family protein [Planctomycetia bacterium]|nr:RidA family protein [Planctomycetia bacterium]
MNRREWIVTGILSAAGLGLTWTFAADEEDTPEARLKELKLELPKLTPPKGATIVPAVRAGDLLYLSGHLPNLGGKLITGKVGTDVSVEDAKKAARDVALISLAVIRNELGSLNKVVRLVKTLGMVNCGPDFIQQPAVINGFSDLMVQVFGEKNGKGARSAVGMASLPNGGCLEIECIFQVK